jgi:hypothetical protein
MHKFDFLGVFAQAHNIMTFNLTFWYYPFFILFLFFFPYVLVPFLCDS